MKNSIQDINRFPLNQRLASELHEENDHKIVMVIADGLGGLPLTRNGLTELESADRPHLNTLAQEGVCGRITHVAPGITPGSGPGHLALFGYDPFFYRIGRGIVEALGSPYVPKRGEVLFRGNFVTRIPAGVVTSRKASGIATEEAAPLVERLKKIQLSDPDIELAVEQLPDHRFLLVVRGPGLGDAVRDTDPLKDGRMPLRAEAVDPDDEASCRTAACVREFVEKAEPLVADHPKGNSVAVRGCSKLPEDWPTFPDLYGLRAAAYAAYPMYRGLARLIGMETIGDPSDLEEEIHLLKGHWEEYDFHFLHFKTTDREGEFGRFEGKIKAIEQLDRLLPRVTDLNPSVLIVTGDHSTPATYAAHSWHPVPMLLAADTCCPDACTSFGEREAIHGGLGDIRATDLMLIALGHAGRLRKYE